MVIEAISQYLASELKTPFFVFVSDKEYLSVKDSLSALDLTFLQLSSYCPAKDKVPEIDTFHEGLKKSDKNLAVLGLGEYLAILGSKAASSELSELKNAPCKAKVVLLLRGLASQIAELNHDPRFDSRRYTIIDNAACNLSFTVASPSMGMLGEDGIKALLAKFENGAEGDIAVNTAINFDDALFTVHKINNTYEGIKFALPLFNLPSACGSEEQWGKLLLEINQHDISLDRVFENYGFADDLETDFYSRIMRGDYKSWLYFIALKYKAEMLTNSYLRFAVGQTDYFEEIRSTVLNAIRELPRIDKRFSRFYEERKKIIKDFPDSDIAEFVVNNRIEPSESIYRLTDATMPEREEIIAWVAQNGFTPIVAEIYPALAAYQAKYFFTCPNLPDLLTEYFEAYKLQKLTNRLDEDFLKQVNELAQSPHKYIQLPTRNEVLEKLKKDGAFLYWFDGLGVEYLAFIKDLVYKRGLLANIYIARAELPTITDVNKDFFKNWDSGKKEKNKALDDVKHCDDGGYNFENNKLPIHLAKELEIVAAAIDKAATLLRNKCARILIASDHGASRLAVINEKECKWEMVEKGKFSGRFCSKNEADVASEFATDENGYWVLANYDRFKGGRKASVEVHGGASLEEVVIPVIELTLKKENITVKLVKDVVSVDFRNGCAVQLFFNSIVKDVYLVLRGKRYPATPIDEHHYAVALADITRSGEYPAEVHTGDNLIGKVLIKAEGKGGKVNDAFNDLF
jgi:hypothetical protein